MANTPNHVGRPQQVIALGQTWTLSRWDRRTWAEFLDWAKTQLPDPRKTAAEFLAMLPHDDPSRESIVAKALDEANTHLSISSPRVKALLESSAGVTRLVYLLLKPNHPEITEETAYDIVTTADNLNDVLTKCAGVAPGKGPSPGE